jgi:hypothetical protein
MRVRSRDESDLADDLAPRVANRASQEVVQPG